MNQGGGLITDKINHFADPCVYAVAHNINIKQGLPLTEQQLPKDTADLSMVISILIASDVKLDAKSCQTNDPLEYAMLKNISGISVTTRQIKSVDEDKQSNVVSYLLRTNGLMLDENKKSINILDYAVENNLNIKNLEVNFDQLMGSKNRQMALKYLIEHQCLLNDQDRILNPLVYAASNNIKIDGLCPAQDQLPKNPFELGRVIAYMVVHDLKLDEKTCGTADTVQWIKNNGKQDQVLLSLLMWDSKTDNQAEKQLLQEKYKRMCQYDAEDQIMLQSNSELSKLLQKPKIVDAAILKHSKTQNLGEDIDYTKCDLEVAKQCIKLAANYLGTSYPPEELISRSVSLILGSLNAEIVELQRFHHIGEKARFEQQSGVKIKDLASELSVAKFGKKDIEKSRASVIDGLKDKLKTFAASSKPATTSSGLANKPKTQQHQR